MAESYVVAVEALAHHADKAIEPFHMMVGHAFELSMKAVLAHSGRDEEWLMMIGHNLDYCHRQARSSGFSGHADEELAAWVELLAGPHHDQRFRYPVLFGGSPHLVANDAAEFLRLHLEDVRIWLSSNPPKGSQGHSRHPNGGWG